MIGDAYGGHVRTGAQVLGDDAESFVIRALERLGWRILARNVRVGRGELDIVAVDPGPPSELVVVEVRWRSTRSFGLPEESIDRRKRLHLRAAIGRLLEMGRAGETALPGLPIRVDIVVVEPPPSGASLDDQASPGRLRHHRAISI